MPRIIFPTSTRTKFAEDNHISPPNLDQESSLLQDQDSVLELYQDQDLDIDIAHMFDHWSNGPDQDLDMQDQDLLDLSQNIFNIINYH
jgi:hypothetical protein